MTTGVFFLLLAALAVVFFAICIWSYHASQHEERLERIIQMQQLTLSCRDNSISWANSLLSNWVTELLIYIKKQQCDDSKSETEPGDEAKTEPEAVEPKDEIDTTEPISEVKPEVADSVEESA